jgi:hypothetical protein
MELILDGVVSPALVIPSTFFPTVPHSFEPEAFGKCGAFSWTGKVADFARRKIPTMLADHVEKNSLQGKLKYSLFVGASSGAETENRWAALNMIERRSPHQVGKQIAKGINNGNIKFFDKHLSMFPVDLVYVSSSLARKERGSDSQRASIPRIGQTRNWMLLLSKLRLLQKTGASFLVLQ